MHHIYVLFVQAFLLNNKVNNVLIFTQITKPFLLLSYTKACKANSIYVTVVIKKIITKILNSKANSKSESP